jgi:type II secretory pathway component GspD/PulD (secretin)
VSKRRLRVLTLAVFAGITAFLPVPIVRGQERSAQPDEARARAQEGQARANQQTRTEDLSGKGYLQKVIQVQHADVHALQAVFRNWVADIQASSELRLLTVVGEPEAIARLEQAIKELDVPEKWGSLAAGEITRTFTIRNATTPGELQEIATTIRGITDVRRLFVVNSLNALTIRGTPEQLDAAEKVIQATDKPPSMANSGNVEIVVNLLEGTNQPS